jgi:two-component system sensor histidine kinase/response regulator
VIERPHPSKTGSGGVQEAGPEDTGARQTPASREECASRPTILLVDDDRRNRTLLRDYLESRYRVLEAENGRGGLEVLEREPVDLVLLDVMMPELSGFDTCRLIRERGGEGFLPVLLLTALNEQDDRNAGLSAGADDFLTKPVDRRELLLRVQAFLKMRQQDAMIRRQLADLKHLQALKDDLVSLLVHDVRNPLMGVQGFLELLQRKLAKTGQPDVTLFLERATESSQRLREILEDMLNVRLLEAGELHLVRERLSLGVLAADAVATLEGAAKSQKVGLSLTVADEVFVRADRKLSRRCLENLLANAVKYSRSGDIIEVTVRRVERGGSVEIADRGPGIPDALKTEVFEKFGSVEAKRDTARRGYGLGLYLVRLVLQAHEGSVSVIDRPGGGSIFHTFMPS